MFGDILSDQLNPSRVRLAAKNIGSLTRFDVTRLSPSRLRAALSGRESIETLRLQSGPSDNPWNFPIEWEVNPWRQNLFERGSSPPIDASHAVPGFGRSLGYDIFTGRPGYLDRATGRVLPRSASESERDRKVFVIEPGLDAFSRMPDHGQPQTTPVRAWADYFNFKQKPWYQKPVDAVVDFCKHVAAVANAVWKAVHKDPVPTEKSA